MALAACLYTRHAQASKQATALWWFCGHCNDCRASISLHAQSRSASAAQLVICSIGLHEQAVHSVQPQHKCAAQ